eukprot:CAMPEP_0174830968 /NCGR_PEP_ID=MMETSP1114-20130205/2825_1 /TAXON_ID=312471 /ORGANISM="Neobodo designis, Strain CCAP 1951/1" /LENGTH=802 /DNA_ID=CAMNT_0016064779 /DNA_START=89 /DNA_END=2497 /DNA_ORIENTATION=-
MSAALSSSATNGAPAAYSERTEFFKEADAACQRRLYDTAPMLSSWKPSTGLAEHAADASNPCALPANWITSGDPATALELAIRRGSHELNSKVKAASTSLQERDASSRGAAEVMDRVAEICSREGILTTPGATALSVALVYGRWEFVEKLMRAGASVVHATCSELGLTAHHLVCAAGDADLVESFVKVVGASAFFAARSEVGNLTPFHVAAALGRIDVLDWAMEYYSELLEDDKAPIDNETGDRIPHPASVAGVDGEYAAHFLARWRYLHGGDALLHSTSLSLPRADITTDTLCDLLRFSRKIPDDDDSELPMWWINLRPCVNARKEHVLHLCHPFVASELIETLLPSHGHASSASLRADSDERNAVSKAIVDALFDDRAVDGTNAFMAALHRGEGEFVGIALKLIPGDELRPRLVESEPTGSLLHLAVRQNQPDAARHLVNAAGQQAAQAAVKTLFKPTFDGDDGSSDGAVVSSTEQQEAWCRGAFAFAAAKDGDENTALHIAASSQDDCSAAATAIVDPLIRGVTRLAAEMSRNARDVQLAMRVRRMAEDVLFRTPNRTGMTPLHECVAGEFGAQVAASILRGATAIESSLLMLSPQQGPANFSPPGPEGGPPLEDVGPPTLNSTPASPTFERPGTAKADFLDSHAPPPSAIARTAEKRPAHQGDNDDDDDAGPPLAVEVVSATHGAYDLNALQLACSQGSSAVVRAIIAGLAAHGGPLVWMNWTRAATGDTCAHLAASSGDASTAKAVIAAARGTPGAMANSFFSKRNKSAATAAEVWRKAYQGRDDEAMACFESALDS